MRQKFRTDNVAEDMRPSATYDNYEELLMNTLAGDMNSRHALASALGYSFGGDRDIYDACGYIKNLTCKDYYSKYLRDDIASTIVDAYPEATWSGFPDIQEAGKENIKDETTFETEWIKIVKDLRLGGKFLRADRLTGLGHYAIMVLGFSGSAKETLENPVTGTDNKLIYVQPYSEKNCEILKWEENQADPRFGLPVMYEIKPRPLTEATNTSHAQKTFKVHWTRVIHLVEKPLDNEVYGTPRLEAVFNRLMDILKIAGGSAEGIWRGAFPGHAAVATPGHNFGKGAREEMKAQFENYRHNLTRVLTLEGVDVKNLDNTQSNPKWAMELQIALISGTSRIPQRMFTGSERGELASSQDESNWNRRVDERKNDMGTGVFIRPFIDRCIEFGALPDVEEYSVIWDSQDKKDPQAAATTAKTVAESLKIYIEGSGDLLIPPAVFLRNILALDEEIIEMIERILGMDIEDAEDILERRVEEAEAARAATAALVAKGIPKEGDEKDDDTE